MDAKGENSYLIAVEDFDLSLLPADARTPGTDSFRKAVSDFIAKDYAQFGGHVRIVVGNEQIEVHWRSDPKAPNPIHVAGQKLQQGKYDEGVRLLETLLRQEPDNPEVLLNLGMALSDMGKLDQAETCLRNALRQAPGGVDILVALGVALTRQRRNDEAIDVLREAVKAGPNNLWAQRNLGGCLLRAGQIAEAEEHLRKAVEISPQDQQSLLGLAQAFGGQGKLTEANDLYSKVIEIDPTNDVAEAARDERRSLAELSFRSASPGNVRPDATMYLLDALRKFDKLGNEEVKKIAFEIAVLGRKGFNTNSPEQQYELRSLPGKFSGLHLVCLMYVGFKIVAPTEDIGFDLSKEYAVAQAMHGKK